LNVSSRKVEGDNTVREGTLLIFDLHPLIGKENPSEKELDIPDRRV
jgi:hypothetical protein